MPIRTDDAGCGRVMERVLQGGQIKWACYCGNTYPGSPEDSLLAEGDQRGGGRAFTTDTYIRAAPTDRVARRVLRDCPRCHGDTMVAIRGDRMELIYLCPYCDAKKAVSPVAATKAKK